MARGGGMRWLGWLVAGLLAVVAGVWVLVTRLTADQLSRADQVASVVAAVVAVGGVPLAVYGVVLARRALVSAGPSQAAGGGLVQRVRAGGDAMVAGRDLTVGRGESRGRWGSGRGGGDRVEKQDVQADREATVAGRDLDVEDGRDVG
ncbi:hypothetical protein O7623_18750 [Solwaraspora sp. WMMD791]|uniref:hypothetical protein n=1 Tax=Solwaraspora sp. WMMD791 TaxID=3016086 RepID=UPI00249B59DA|nr:hypothetical protein [Solwaraspora sp. WMMD791]WFE25425.1 hypothetical protein O7623_18750 [Solwaraspora sp. WMMD791]